MNNVVTTGIQAALVMMVGLFIVSSYRVWICRTAPEKLQAIDGMVTVLIGVITTAALVLRIPFILDIAIALAAFSFIGTLAISRYLSEGKVF